VFVANRRQHFKTLRRVNASGKGAQGCALNRRAIRQRIGERNPQLQGVGAGFNQRIDDL
jgi:hypothetical protein